MLTWNDVVRCFPKSEASVLRAPDKTQEYWSQSALFGTMTANDPGILYTTFTSAMAGCRAENGVALIIFADAEFDVAEWIANQDVGNVLLVNTGFQTSKGIAEMNELFQEQFRVGRVLSRLQDAVVADRGVQVLVDIIADFFRTPVGLMDGAFRFLAKSDAYPLREEQADYPELIHGNAISEETLAQLRSEGMLDDLIRQRSTFSKTAINETAYFTPIYIANIKAAFLILSFSKDVPKLPQGYDNYLELMANMISIELSKNNYFLFNKGNYFNYIFSMILSGEVGIDDVRTRLAANGHILQEWMYLIEVDTTPLQENLRLKERVAEMLRGIIPNSFYVYQEEKLYFLLSRDHRTPLTDREIENWKHFLQVQKLSLALTGPFTDFSNMREHTRRTDLLLRYNRTREVPEPVLIYEENQMRAMLALLSQQEDLRLFYYQPVVDLCSYDEAHGTELVKTLKEYLHHPKDIGTICDALHIHKNTLYKRLDKIDQIMDCDFRDGEIIMRIELTLEMMKR